MNILIQKEHIGSTSIGVDPTSIGKRAFPRREVCTAINVEEFTKALN